MSDLGGVWRTVGGRRIFIKDGEDLATAMTKSGKFKNLKKRNKGEDAQNKKDLEKYKDYLNSDKEDFIYEVSEDFNMSEKDAENLYNRLTSTKEYVKANKSTSTDNDDIYSKLDIDGDGYYTYKEKEYRMRFDKKNDRYQISSSHPYDLTDYSYALSKTDDVAGKWTVYNPVSHNITTGVVKKDETTISGMDKALKLMKELDKKKRQSIDRT